jgi:SAM-dependent methyltransferase
MMPTQDQVFAGGEADQWFLRNRSALSVERAQDDPVVRALSVFGLTPRRVLEVGASNGWRLAALAGRRGGCYVAVEPSAQAIADGEARFPAVEFRRGLLTDLPLVGSETFDLVIASFVLHWVDRCNLLRAAAEIDRATVDGGTIAIADFLPDRPTRVPYHHLPAGGMYTFKQDYAALFAAAGTYRVAGRLPFDHATHEFRPEVSSGDRCAVTLLVKSLTGLYEDRRQP